jgi:hypothetical protein
MIYRQEVNGRTVKSGDLGDPSGPVTARIRERMAVEKPEAVSAEKVKPVSDEPPATAPATVIALPEPVKPAMDYRHEVTRRRGDGRQMSLF